MRSRAGADRIVLAFLMALMTAGSLALWTVVPLGALWAVSLLDVSLSVHLLLGLIAVPAAIMAFATALMRVNDLYIRADDALTRQRGGHHDHGSHSRGPLEWLVVGSLVVAIVLMIAWMIFVAGDPFPWTTPTA